MPLSLALCLLAAPLAARAQAPPPTLAPPQVAAKWRTGRTLQLVGTSFGVIASGMVLGGLVTAKAYDSTLGSALVYMGTGANGLGFILSATGLGMQHGALDMMGVPVGHSLYGFGTAFGVLGLLGVGAGYYFGAAGGYLPTPQDQLTAALTCSLGGSLLMTVSSILYYVDSRRMHGTVVRLGVF